MMNEYAPVMPTSTEAAPDAQAASDTMTRRDFLTWIAGGSMAVTGLFSLRTVLMVIFPPARSIEGKTKVGPMPVATVADLKPGVPKIVEYGDDFVFVVKLDATKIIALNAACPHVACKLHFNEQSKEYDCPCHASSFAIDGKKLGGPAPRDMIPATFEVESGQVVLSGFEA